MSCPILYIATVAGYKYLIILRDQFVVSCKGGLGEWVGGASALMQLNAEALFFDMS